MATALSAFGSWAFGPIEPVAATGATLRFHGTNLCHYLFGLRLQGARAHADRRLPIHLRLQAVRTPYAAHQGEVLRVLLIRVGSMPAGAGWELPQLACLRNAMSSLMGVAHAPADVVVRPLNRRPPVQVSHM
jgi:hypothetical protein